MFPDVRMGGCWMYYPVQRTTSTQQEMLFAAVIVSLLYCTMDIKVQVTPFFVLNV
jgi:hypothetical protein